jgi:hypothetical protein
MTTDEIVQIVEVYNQITKHRTIDWQEIYRVYEYFDNKIEKFPREKVWRIKSLVENNPELILKAEEEYQESFRRRMSIKIKNQIPVPHLKPRKIWVNNMNKLLQYE